MEDASLLHRCLTVDENMNDMTHSLSSPDGRLRVQISESTFHWSATFRGKPLLSDAKLSLEVVDEGDLLVGARQLQAKQRTTDEQVKILFGKADKARNRYQELRLSLETPGKRRFDVVFRCYDDAIALRYEIPAAASKESLTIADEGTSLTLAGNPLAYVQYLENYNTSHEHNVAAARLQDVKPDTLLDMPATFAFDDSTFVAITEASLRRYAGMSLMRPKESTELACRLTPRPDGTKVVRELPLETPWRVVLVADRVGALLESNTLYCLNEPSTIKDTSWIKPGKLTFNWWNGNLYEAQPTEPILSLSMNKKYIDFCAKSGIPYHSVIADETTTPWYKQTRQGVVPGPDTDVTKVRADLDLDGIRRYATSKGVRLWTWVHQAALRGRVEEAFAAFERFGWSGMMVDFFDHDDQDSVEHAEAILQAAARHKILIHLHGVWKPTGWQRTYPNLMNHEASLNFEVFKWDNRVPPEHTLLMAFTRQVAGPTDYHLGGFRAVKRVDFKPRFIGPNVLGTRCHQLALYLCFDNPSPMIADYPAAYEGQPGFDFLQIVPTWWDETRVLVGEIGEVLVTARRRGRDWYIGCISAKKARNLALPLAFLGRGEFVATIWRDAPESMNDPNRLNREKRTATAQTTLQVPVAFDGGFVVQFTRK